MYKDNVWPCTPPPHVHTRAQWYSDADTGDIGDGHQRGHQYQDTCRPYDRQVRPSKGCLQIRNDGNSPSSPFDRFFRRARQVILREGFRTVGPKTLGTGTLGTRTLGTKDGWSKGHLVQKTIGPKDGWDKRQLVQRTKGPTQCKSRQKVQQLKGPKDKRYKM